MNKLIALVALLAALQTRGQSTVYIALTAAIFTNTVYSVQSSDVITPTVISGTSADFVGSSAVGNIKLVTGQTYTGLTNLIIIGNSSVQYATYQITHQSTCVVSNYVPADAIVIPASATGSVNIILESSPDLVNWTAADPGIYSAANGTNRFFRVRAAVQ